DAGADDPVGAPDDLALVAGQPVGQEEQHPVLLAGPFDLGEAGGRFGAGLPEPAAPGVGGGGGHGEARAAEGGDDDAGVPRAGGGDLPGGGAADERHVGAGRLGDAGAQLGQVVAVGAEDDD